MKIFTSCFGEKFIGAVERLGRQIEDLKGTYEYFVFDNQNIKNDKELIFIKEFALRNQDALSESKGYLWYIWKPWIINAILKNLKEGEIFAYLDAGTELSLAAEKNLEVFVEGVKINGSTFFRNPQTVADYTRTEVLTYYANQGYDFSNNQIAGGILFLRNDEMTRTLVHEWCNACLINDGDLFKDKGFPTHRHDQSILSIIVQKFKFNVVDYPIWFEPESYLSKEVLNFPIHTLRNSSNVSLLETYTFLLKVPNRLWRMRPQLFTLASKLLFFARRKLSKQVVWDEKWTRFFDSQVKEHIFADLHRTQGDLRRLESSSTYKLTFQKKDIIFNQNGVYKEQNSHILFRNAERQFGNSDGKVFFRNTESLPVKNGVVMISQDDNNLFHFIYDLLYKALYLKNRSLDYTALVRVQPHNHWKEKILSLSNISYQKLDHNGTAWGVRDAFVIPSGAYSGDPGAEVIELLSSSFKSIAKKNPTRYSSRIYIPRAKSNSRTILKNNRLDQFLKENNFLTLELEDFDVSEQINIFSNAEIIVAAHGAGLSWLPACEKSTCVIELFAKPYINFVYGRISKKIGLEYHSFLCDYSMSRHFSDPDLIVSDHTIDAIEKLIKTRAISKAPSDISEHR